MTGAGSTYRAAMVIAWRALPESISPTVRAVRLGVIPLLTSMFYLAMASGAGAADPDAGDALAASVGVGSVAASVAVATLVAEDRFEGTTPVLFIAPHGTVASWLGRFTVVAGLGVLVATVGLLATLMVVQPSGRSDSWGIIALVLIGVAPAAIGIGFLIGAASLSLRDSLLLSNIAEYVLPLAAGVVAPLSVLWHPIDLVARVIPLANLIEAGRTGVDEGMSEGFWGDYALALGTGAVWVIAAVVVWGRFERRARRVGTLESSAF